MSDFRIEKDSMGEMHVPKDALYGAQTQRAINNFQISGRPLPFEFIQTIAEIKRAAAKINKNLGLLDSKVADAIVQAADEVLAGKHQKEFPIDIFQTGSGTSTNMNVNEVLASLASKLSGQKISANDHVNMSQSSNDVIPTAIHLSAIFAVEKKLLPALDKLIKSLQTRENELKLLAKTGRTHLMDAMPITFGQEISGWRTQIEHSKHRIQEALHFLRKLPLGGTAVGTGINAHPDFAANFATLLSKEKGTALSKSDNFFEALSCQDAAVSLSGQLKTLAVGMIKIANDLRWMNSGPLAGIGEIELVALQPGSSIMPGKVNPVIPEAVVMVGAEVIGADATITLGGSLGNFQLNVMLPVIADRLLNSIHILSTASTELAHCVSGFKVKVEQAQKALASNPILVTALNPIIGYLKAAEIAKKAYKESLPILEVAKRETNLSEEELKKHLDPLGLTKGGIHQGGGSGG